jgi:hypothetical protein
VRSLRLLLPLAACLALPATASAAKLIAPLDVKVTPIVRPTTMTGTWTVARTTDLEGVEHGEWTGTTKLTEEWTRGGEDIVTRVRGRASGGPAKTTNAPFRYLRKRTGDGGALVEIGDEEPRRVLRCGALGGLNSQVNMTDSGRSVLRIADDPKRGKVTIWGPAVSFWGPTCTTSYGDRDCQLVGNCGGSDCTKVGQCVDRENVTRTLGMLPPGVKDPFLPLGETHGWKVVVPRAEFAAGGTFRFRDQINGSWFNGGDYSEMESDVSSTARAEGRFAIDLRVRRVGR